MSKDNLMLLLDGQTAHVVLCGLEDIQLNGLKYLKEKHNNYYWKSTFPLLSQ